MFLLDREVTEGIYGLTMKILQRYFFYDKETLDRFADEFVDTIAYEYRIMNMSLHPEDRWELEANLLTRKYFTTYFVSYNLHDILVEKFFFTELELDCFENLIPNP
jgi:hypothetical protein